MLHVCLRRLQGASAPQSVLRTLQRLRQQYQRPLQRRETPMAGCETSQSKQRLADEALKLLRREVRGSDMLSDVSVVSSSFCIEVGKLLSVAAAFGATTTTQRVAEALQWVRINKSSLLTTRQVMSVAMPLLNLKDGKSLGRQFVMEELVTPLLTSLEASVSTATMNEVEMKQHYSAIVSVFSLVNRLLECDDNCGVGDAGGGETKDIEPEGPSVGMAGKTLASGSAASVLRRSVAELLRKAADALLSATASASSFDVQDCTHTLLAFQRFESLCSDVDADGVKDMEEMHAVLLPLQQVLGTAFGSCASGAAKRPGDLCHLLSCALKLKHRESMIFFSRGAVSLLPLALASATVKEMSMAVSLLVRLRSCAPEVADGLLVQRIVGAMRPKLFLLAETHPETLRHIESSLLLANLTRLDTEVSEDLVNLLCSSFASHMDSVQPSHLIPFLQGLCRFGDYHTRSVKDESYVTVWDAPLLPAVLPCLRRSADRVVTLASARAVTTVEAAQLLLLFSQLHSALSLTVYASLDSQLVGAASRFVEVSNVTCDESNDGVSDGHAVIGHEDPSGVFTLMNALDTFREKCVPVRREEEELLLRAGELYEMVRQGAMGTVEEIQDPKSLVKLLGVLIPGLGAPFPAGEEETAVHNSAATVTYSPSAQRSFDSAANQVIRLAPMANAYEVGALAKYTRELLSKDLIGEAVAREAMKSLVEQSGRVEMTLHDIQSLLDGMRQVREVQISASLLWRAGTLLSTAPKKTTSFLRCVLPIIKNAAIKPCEKEALSALKRIAMQNARDMLETDVMTISPRDVVLLAYTLAQLQAISSEPAAEGADDSEDVDSDAAEREVSSDLLSKGDDFGVVHDTFTMIGDAVCLQMQQSPYSCGVATGGGWQMTPQEVVMLVQSFEKVEVGHHSLLYELLPLVRDMSPAMGPLELSLLLSAFARLGVWNGRILNTLACNVAERMQMCSLKQCQVVLQALQSSRFLRPTVFLPSAEYQESSSCDWKPVCTPDGSANADPLVTLAVSIVKRMDALVENMDSVSTVLESYTLREIMAFVSVLGFFEHPPQPSFDTYMAICVKKLLLSLRTLSGNDVSWDCRQNLMACVSLAGYVCKLRKYRHQCTSARVIAGVLSPLYIESATLKAGLLLMPEEKLSELYCYRCAYAMLYGAAFAADEASLFLLPLFEKLKAPEVSQDARRVCRALRSMTRMCSRDAGDISMVSEIVLHCASAIHERRPGNMGEGSEEGSVGAEKPFVLQRKETVALIESLCAAWLFRSRSDERDRSFLEVLKFSVDNMLRFYHGTGGGEDLRIATKDVGTSISAGECGLVLLGLAITGAVTNTCEAMHASALPQLTELQRTILMKEHDLSVHDSVNILLARALCSDDTTVCWEVVECASRALQSQMGKTDRTGLWLHSELYRLVTAGDACFVTYCVGLPEGGCRTVFDTCVRVVPALLHALRSEKRNISPSLSLHCRVHVAECLRQLLQLAPDREGIDGLVAALEELLEDVGTS
ncbi:hypothetical protein, conserved [Trypanosoma brucei gambiense DAL972]|uniref:Uncharacterized protein n=1 Tax=Trypanosoma brucei gambiense (strain MHOM/CI/86/DAL972) TaxID=679716 RepID=D0A321_TRYB9|nr:hypothetical protein, conserved [Trypanosoma brucei gambiense DAL972]CBH15665.1 hypothetical protein, conserved [Trypanosoma brucei gambiense DAL972]|eukprot:XP_011777929.1 hypothetical protein, conserved [Trypanosoma brucei gambiense DAL972]